MDSEKAASFNLNLGYIIVAIFILPLFLTLPPWYGTMEAWIAGFLIVMQVVLGCTMVFLIKSLFKNKKADVPIPPCTDQYVSPMSVMGWAIVAIITFSMYSQGMDTLATLYLLFAIIIGGLRFEKIRIWRKLFPSQGAT